MDAEELAFAGIARQAELIRAGEVSSRELAELYLERIERLDPELNAFTEVLGERALAEADAADARRGAGEAALLLGVPVAIKDNVDVEGAATRYGTRAFDATPAGADGEVVRRLRAAGRGDPGQDDPLGAGDPAVHRDARPGARPATPGTPAARSGGSSGGSARGGRRRARRRGLGDRRRRLDPDPGGVLRPRRAEAAARPGADGAARPLEQPLRRAGCVTRTVADTALYLDVVTAGGGDPGGPQPPEQPFAGRAATPPARLRIAISERPARAILPPVVSRRGQGRARRDRGSCCARSATTSAATSPRSGSPATTSSPATSAGSARTSRRCPTPNGSSRAPAGSARLGRAYPAAVVRSATRAAAADAEQDQPQLERVRRPGHADGGRDGDRDRPLGGQGRAADPARRSAAPTPSPRSGTTPASRRRRSRPGSPRAGLPRSVTLVGRPSEEATLLSLAAQLEAERPWADRRPPLVIDRAGLLRAARPATGPRATTRPRGPRGASRSGAVAPAWTPSHARTRHAPRRRGSVAGHRAAARTSLEPRHRALARRSGP